MVRIVFEVLISIHLKRNCDVDSYRGIHKTLYIQEPEKRNT